MSQIRLLKINAAGTPEEHANADEVTFTSFTVQGGGQVLSSTGLALGNTDISGVKNLSFNAPSTDVINFTAGNGIIDDIMLKDRDNVMGVAGAVLFPTITDAAGKVDSFKVPMLAGAPTATPSYSTDAGFMVYDSSGKAMYVWDGAAWDNMNTVAQAESIQNSYTAEEALAATDVVYISSADSVSKAKADAVVTAQAIGFASAAALITAPVPVQSGGVLAGFSGLTAGARYYLSGATAGAVTTTPPTSAGHSVMSLGFAKSASAMQIQLQLIGRRA